MLSSCEAWEKLWQVLPYKNKILRGEDWANASKHSLEGERSHRLPRKFLRLSSTGIPDQNQTLADHQLRGLWRMTKTKMGWFGAWKNIHKGFLPESLKAVTALFRKQSWLCSTSFWPSQRLDNPEYFYLIQSWTGTSGFTDSGEKK